jgi:hypothetical protein
LVPTVPVGVKALPWREYRDRSQRASTTFRCAAMMAQTVVKRETRPTDPTRSAGRASNRVGSS